MMSILCLLLNSCHFGEKVTDIRPNFIIILTDDMGYGDLGCYGNTEINTPHIDRMAAAGIRFTDFHSNSAVCTPTRVALLTGRYQQRAGLQNVLRVTDSSDTPPGLAGEEVTFAEVLKTAGYQTGIFGKWHVGTQNESHPLNQGFDKFIGFMTNPDFFSHCGRLGEHDWHHGFSETKEEGYITELISKHSIDFIQQNNNKPFCLYVAHKTPHGPLQGPSDSAIWKENEITRPLPRSARPGDEENIYREMIENLDSYIGQMILTLEQENIAENTLIIFFSDNGPIGIENTNGLKGRKGQLYEGGHRIPAIAYWPEMIQPGTNSDVIMGMDIFPTLLDIAGIDYIAGQNRQLDGISFYPVLKGNSLPERTLFWRTNGGIAVRKGPWKLIRQKGDDNPDKQFMLFNLDKDIRELQDFSEENPALVQQLLEEIRNWESDVDSNSLQVH
ncbi:MAG: sulfatase-like hydrolase/transferase [Bacteroidales bacterium]|nr:sulfatase-like hydrolase/transferase [Bacteroidales bacterium]